MANKNRNWQIIKGKKYSETEKGRDVYNEQQLERGALQKKQTMFSRSIIALLVSLVIAFCVYCGWCIVASLFDIYSSISNNTQSVSSLTVNWGIHSIYHIAISIMSGVISFSIIYPMLRRNLDAQNMLTDTSDINQYSNDQHIALPEEIQRKFNFSLMRVHIRQFRYPL